MVGLNRGANTGFQNGVRVIKQGAALFKLSIKGMAFTMSAFPCQLISAKCAY